MELIRNRSLTPQRRRACAVAAPAVFGEGGVSGVDLELTAGNELVAIPRRGTLIQPCIGLDIS